MRRVNSFSKKKYKKINTQKQIYAQYISTLYFVHAVTAATTTTTRTRTNISDNNNV